MGLTFFSSRTLSPSDALIKIWYPISSTVLAICTVVRSSNPIFSYVAWCWHFWLSVTASLNHFTLMWSTFLFIVLSIVHGVLLAIITLHLEFRCFPCFV
jgi:hypothetical protein